MDLKQMRAFVHVADQRSFSRAASVLRTTQPSLSRQIRQIESELGTKLLHRHGHGVALTGAGAILFERCKRILSDVEDLRGEVASQRPGVTGLTTLGVPAPMAWRFADPFLDRFSKQFPGVTLRIVEGFSGFLHDWLLSGIVDLAIMYGPRQSKIIDATQLLIEDLYAIGPPNDGRKVISVEELAAYPLILPHPPHVIRSLIHDAGLQPARLIEVDSLSLMVELAHQGKGFSLLPMTAVRQEILSGYVSTIAIEKPALSWGVTLCKNDLRPISPATEVLFAHIKIEVADMVLTGRWDARLAAHLSADK